MTGIGYDPTKVGGDINSVDDLLTNPKLKGKVTLLTELADTMGLVMLSNGDDPSKVTDKTWNAAKEKIQKAVKSGQVRQFTGNDYAPLLAKGDVWACFAWSGDMVQLQADHPGLKWVLPKTGGMIWTDNMLIPKGGNVYAASVLMNWFYNPKIAAEVEDYVNYICPVQGAAQVLKKTDPKVANNPLIFPPKSYLDNTHIFDGKALNNAKYKQDFQHLIGA
jgi:spermidine/putrescine transport system substrate-binding protein